MRPPLLNALTPWGWLAAGLLVLIALTLAAGAAGFRWDPFGLAGRRLERARSELEIARSDIFARRIEQAAETDQRARLTDHNRKTTAVAALTAAAEARARSADDADQPLDPDRTRRLHELDSGLCGLAPDLEGCASASGAPGRGGPALRAGGPPG